MTTPLAAYGFDEGSGSTVGDATGNGHDLTIENGAFTASGHTGPGYRNTGLGNGATGSVPAVTGTNASLMAWVRPSSLTAGETQLVCGSLGPGDASTYFVIWSQRGDFSTANVLQGGARLGGGVVPVNGAALDVDVWAHVALTYDGFNLRLYRDATLVATVANTNTISNATTFYVGGHEADGVLGPGDVDDVRYFDVTLSQAEIATYMDTPAGGGGGTDYDETASDDVGMLDDAAPVATVERDQPDDVGLSDAPSVTATVARVTTDDAGILDDVTVTATVHTGPTDAVGLTDAVTVGGSRSLTLTDGVGVTDVATVPSVHTAIRVDVTGISISGPRLESLGPANIPLDGPGIDPRSPAGVSGVTVTVNGLGPSRTVTGPEV